MTSNIYQLHEQLFMIVLHYVIFIMHIQLQGNINRIRCYKCREYNHFVKDCPTSREEKEIEQLQQMLNLGDEQPH